MNAKPLLAVSALAVICAGWFAGAGASAGYAPHGVAGSARAAAAGPQQPELDTWSANPSLGATPTTGVAVSIPATAAEMGKVTMYLPAGYGLDSSAWPGTGEGDVFVASSSDFSFGDLEAADPSAYVNNPQAQACAPGKHAAVWVMSFPYGFFTPDAATVPIYIDPTSGDEAALGAYKLQTCLPLARISSPGGRPQGEKLTGLMLDFSGITNPSSAANYVWRAFVSNPDGNGNPDPATTYELRSDMPLPARLSLAKRMVRNRHRALLSGRLTTPAAPSGGVTVTLYRLGSLFGVKAVATTRTSADGSYRFPRAIAKSGRYAAEAAAVGTCTSASTAPKGCLSETRAAVDSTVVRISLRHRH
jgi:hypothetical protein